MFKILLLINLLCILSVIFVERKRPQATIAWVLVMNFLPIIGAVIYILLGSTAIPAFGKKIRLYFEKYDEYTNHFYRYLDLNKEEVNNSNDENLAKYKDIIYTNMSNNGSLYSEGNSVKVYTNAKEKYDDLISDIENAKHTINIEYFIIRTDETGKRLVNALSKKASEGVEVNLLYDELGSLRTTKRFFSPLIKNGGNVERFLTRIFTNLIRFNHRNHRKIVVIDGKIGYTGGMNIGNEYMGEGKIKNWRDTHIRIEGPSVHMLQVLFMLDWILSCRKKVTSKNISNFEKYFPHIENTNGNIGMQIVSSGPDSKEQQIKYGLFKMITGAKNNIYIQTPYFVPDEALFEALKIAAMSGVDVRIMIPAIPDKKYVYYITRSYAEELLEYGVKIYLYNGFIHSKTIVTDSYVTSVGTANFDVRSFVLNFEVNAFMFDEAFAKENENIFFKDCENSSELTLEASRKTSVFKKVLRGICRLFAPLA
ncbi:MAG: cardiolipin synthase [Clostridia bacterium]|nr:cardiolipin synthase [Clostridia bacterium]